MDVSATTRVIARVEYFAGTELIGVATTAPFGFTWPAAPTGGFVVTARLTDDVGDSVRSAPVLISVGEELRLSAAFEGVNLVLRWQGGTAPFTVERKLTLTDATWETVTTTSERTASVPVTGPSVFLRVRGQ